MLRALAAAICGGGIALWVLLSQTSRRDRDLDAAPRWPWGLAGAGALVTVIAAGPGPAAVVGVVVGICSWCAAVLPRSRRRVQSAESMAQFAAVLANQAQVSRTVVDALETAAPLATGPTAQAATKLVSECRSLGVESAALQFAADADTPAAQWLADVVAVAAASGGQWVPILGVLETEAAEAAATARHYHRKIAANLPQLGLSAALGTAVATGSALVSPDAWAWLAGPQGQRLGLAAVVLAAAICFRPLAAAWELLR